MINTDQSDFMSWTCGTLAAVLSSVIILLRWTTSVQSEYSLYRSDDDDDSVFITTAWKPCEVLFRFVLDCRVKLGSFGQGAEVISWWENKSSLGYMCVLLCMYVRMSVYLCVHIGFVCVCVCFFLCARAFVHGWAKGGVIIQLSSMIDVPMSTYFYKTIILKCNRTFAVSMIHLINLLITRALQLRIPFE